MVLFSLAFNTITERLFGNYPTKTKMYYLEIFGIWLILVCVAFNIKININRYGKDKITHYIKENGEIEKNDVLYKQIDEIEKMDLIIIIGFFAIFIGSQQHSYKEKLSLLNEDIGIVTEIFE
jgi:hypothetical protein